MLSREEKNKEIVDEIKHEKAIKITKIVLKIVGVFLLIMTILFLYAYFIGIKGLQVKEYLIKDTNIPSSYNGIKILHISDILYGKTITEKELNKINDEIDLINPNIIVFTGNIVSKDYSLTEDDIKKIQEFFKRMPYTIGKYAVSGDTDSNNFNLILDNTDFEIINNKNLEIYNGKEKINLIGINYQNDDDIKQDSDGYTITLINNFDNYDKYQISSNIVLAGHNLGGEIRLFNLPLLGLDKHLKDYYQEGNTKIYISSGIGSKHHMRFMNKPSMNVYRLYND